MSEYTHVNLKEVEDQAPKFGLSPDLEFRMARVPLMVVGLLARLLVPGRDPIGLLGTLVIGVVGAVLGGWLAGAFFRETEGVDWLASIGVAMLLILLVRSGSRRRAWR